MQGWKQTITSEGEKVTDLRSDSYGSCCKRIRVSAVFGRMADDLKVAMILANLSSSQRRVLVHFIIPGV